MFCNNTATLALWMQVLRTLKIPKILVTKVQGNYFQANNQSFLEEWWRSNSGGSGDDDGNQAFTVCQAHCSGDLFYVFAHLQLFQNNPNKYILLLSYFTDWETQVQKLQNPGHVTQNIYC